MLSRCNLSEFPEYYAKCFDAFKSKSTEPASWTSSLKTILPKLFKCNWDDSKFPTNFKTLSVGCADGDGGDLLICDIVKKFLPESSQKPTIFYQAVEPNADSLAIFRTSADSWAQQNSSVESCFQWFTGGWQDYQSGTKQDPEKFHFIHFLHSLYYMPDVEEILRDCILNRMTSDGLILCVLCSDSPFVRFSEAHNLPRFPSNETIKSVVRKNGWRYDCFSIPYHVDITEILDQSSLEGNLLLDFSTHVKDYRAVCDKSQLESVEEYWLKNSKVGDNGKRITAGQSEAVIVYKC